MIRHFLENWSLVWNQMFRHIHFIRFLGNVGYQIVASYLISWGRSRCCDGNVCLRLLRRGEISDNKPCHSLLPWSCYVHLLAKYGFWKAWDIYFILGFNVYSQRLGEYAQLVRGNDSTAVLCHSLQRNQNDQSSNIYPQHLKKQGFNMLPYYSFLKKSW